MSGFEADAEEREMEREALEAIFAEAFAVDGDACTLRLEPEAEEAHVACVLRAACPADYPSAAPPVLTVAEVTGLGAAGRAELEGVVAAAAAAWEPGCVALFEAATAVRDWLAEHNEPGQADESMRAAGVRPGERAAPTPL